MKLAEALSERADIKKRIEQLENRLILNAKVQDGEKPSEDPKELITELDYLTKRFEELVTKINLRNATVVDSSETLTSLLARKDALTLKINVMRDFLSEASSITSRGTRSEIKILPTIDVASYQKKIDKLSKELRELDVRIQTINWTIDL
ncbi:MAG: DIP1984 family protein [Erysipelotrichaceae bacterium]|nr:DIP1984 family protein [Erysipelotrichaceae bacterium]